MIVLVDIYIVVGEEIQYGELDWGSSFPGSHTFYPTQDDPQKDVLITKPKPEILNAYGKHANNGGPSQERTKKTNLAQILHLHQREGGHTDTSVSICPGGGVPV